jgi:ABC-2 type transport system ATP-binding protein
VSDEHAVVTEALGRRYGSKWALQDCSLAIPAGAVTALVGPNGAGKSTLLHLAIGLIEPTTGDVLVLGHSARREAHRVLPLIGFVAQDHPLYRSFRLGELLTFGRKLNPRWDDDLAHTRLADLGIPLRQKVGTLSGGQQAQVALTLALAKRPEVLLLDEPVASLDPLARRDFLASLMESVAETGSTVVLSSHIVSELERLCDHIVILAEGGVRLAGPIEQIVGSHRLLTGPRTTGITARSGVVQASHTVRQTTLLVEDDGGPIEPGWTSDEVSLEEIVLAYLGRREEHETLAPLRAVAS